MIFLSLEGYLLPKHTFGSGSSHVAASRQTAKDVHSLPCDDPRERTTRREIDRSNSFLATQPRPFLDLGLSNVIKSSFWGLAGLCSVSVVGIVD